MAEACTMFPEPPLDLRHAEGLRVTDCAISEGVGRSLEDEHRTTLGFGFVGCPHHERGL